MGTQHCPGYYLGASWEHYGNHKVWVKDTKSVQNGETVFFKHKYLTHPTVTTEDALIKAADDLSNAVKGFLLYSEQTQVAINKLMEIFKGKARAHKYSAGFQRFLRESALSQRVIKEAEAQPASAAMPRENYVVQCLEQSPLTNSAPQPAIISQEEQEQGPAVRIRGQKQLRLRTLTQEVALQMIDVSSSTCGLSAKSAASRKFPMQFLHEYENAVLDRDT